MEKLIGRGLYLKSMRLSPFLLVVLVASLPLAPVCLEVKASTSDVVILSSSYYMSFGYSYIVGEVQNVGTSNLMFVKITATFYDSSNNVLATAFTYTELLILKPQQKSPFEVSSYPSQNLAVDHYSVTVSEYLTTSFAPYRSFNVRGVTASKEFAFYHVRGEVENIGGVNATYVKVVITFYDSRGAVIGRGLAFTDPKDIVAGSKAPFDCSSFPLEITPASYSLQVDSSEYMLTSTISCSVSRASLSIGSSLTVSGAITPARPGVIVTLTYTLPDATVVNRTVLTASDGTYSDTYTPSLLGVWRVKASWDGDLTYAEASSLSASFTVSKLSSTISCSVQPSEMTEGGSVVVSGSISPAVSGGTVTLNYRRPDGTTFARTVTTGSDGSYSDSYKPDATGSWSVTASWGGDSTHDAASSSSVSFTVRKSGCLIATATYGSELSPNVQFLRGFRDNKVLTTFAGSSFMAVFNGFYYSFSPIVASTISGNEALKWVMKSALYPLIGILHLSSSAFSLFGFNPELGVVIAGLVASSLIGIVYVTPWAMLLSPLRKFKPSRRTVLLTGLVWAGSVVAIALAEASMSSLLMMTSTAAFVLATICLTTLVTVRAVFSRVL